MSVKRKVRVAVAPSLSTPAGAQNVRPASSLGEMVPLLEDVSATRRRDWFKNLIAASECVVERDGSHGRDSRRVPVLVEGTEAVTAS
jgi:hypothetical protein